MFVYHFGRFCLEEKASAGMVGLCFDDFDDFIFFLQFLPEQKSPCRHGRTICC